MVAVSRKAVQGVGWVVAGQGPDPLQALRERAYGQAEPSGGLAVADSRRWGLYRTRTHTPLDGVWCRSVT